MYCICAVRTSKKDPWRVSLQCSFLGASEKSGKILAVESVSFQPKYTGTDWTPLNIYYNRKMLLHPNYVCVHVFLCVSWAVDQIEIVNKYDWTDQMAISKISKFYRLFCCCCCFFCWCPSIKCCDYVCVYAFLMLPFMSIYSLIRANIHLLKWKQSSDGELSTKHEQNMRQRCEHLLKPIHFFFVERCVHFTLI